MATAKPTYFVEGDTVALVNNEGMTQRPGTMAKVLHIDRLGPFQLLEVEWENGQRSVEPVVGSRFTLVKHNGMGMLAPAAAGLLSSLLIASAAVSVVADAEKKAEAEQEEFEKESEALKEEAIADGLIMGNWRVLENEDGTIEVWNVEDDEKFIVLDRDDTVFNFSVRN